MTTSAERIATAIGCPPTSLRSEEIERFEALWQVGCPADLNAFWKRWGSGQGFAGDMETSPYLKVYSPSDALKAFGMPEVKQYMPKSFAPFGDDGAGEMIVFVEGRGYGLLSLVHGGEDDVIMVADTLEEFFQKTERGEWFPKSGVTQ